MIAAPEAFPRAFAGLWTAQDAKGLADLFAPDGDFLTLTGDWAEGREAIARALKGEFAGAFARAKLVTGRVKLRALGPHVAVVMQRFVLSGLRHADGSDAGRVGAVLSATLVVAGDGWQVASASLVAAA